MASIAQRRNFFSGSIQKQKSYIDKWFESIVKPESFYDQHANGRVRRYFYNMDLQGQLFLEETVPKNITSSIKDEKFLNFFFSRIRWTKPEEAEFLKDAGFRKHYPFVSLCGREVNFIRPACSPIVYHSIVNSGSDLMYGGNLIQPFQYSNLAISKESGKIYHKLPKLLRETSPTESNRPRTLEYGLLRSSIVISLSERILPTMSENDGRWNIVDSDGTACPIDWLPEGDEPGDWAMQYESTI